MVLLILATVLLVAIMYACNLTLMNHNTVHTRTKYTFDMSIYNTSNTCENVGTHVIVNWGA